MKIFVYVYMSKARTWDKGYYCSQRLDLLKYFDISTLPTKTTSRTRCERFWHFFFCFLNDKWTRTLLASDKNFHKSRGVGAMNLMMIFILLRLGAVVWDDKAPMLCGTCMPEFHCRGRQWICQLSARLQSRSGVLRNVTSLPNEH